MRALRRPGFTARSARRRVQRETWVFERGSRLGFLRSVSGRRGDAIVPRFFFFFIRLGLFFFFFYYYFFWIMPRRGPGAGLRSGPSLLFFSILRSPSRSPGPSFLPPPMEDLSSSQKNFGDLRGALTSRHALCHGRLVGAQSLRISPP